MMPPLSITVLVTREEYSCGAARPLARSAAWWLTVGGAVLLVCGLAGLVFGPWLALSASVAWLLVLCGVALGVYPPLIAPALSKATAAREFDECELCRLATQYRLDEQGITFTDQRRQGQLPWSAITRCRETDELFVLAVGGEWVGILPKRVLTDEDCRRVSAWLTSLSARQ